jgi:hypothetical protein
MHVWIRIHISEPGHVVLLFHVSEELGLGHKLPHQGEEAGKSHRGAEQQQQHAHDRHAGVEEGQVETVNTWTKEDLFKAHQLYHIHALKVLSSEN